LIGSPWAALLFLGVVHGLVAAPSFKLKFDHELIRKAWALLRIPIPPKAEKRPRVSCPAFRDNLTDPLAPFVYFSRPD
jgi:hypothetical protein